MSVEQIEQLVENCIKNKTDMNAKAKMDEAISDYLKAKKVTDEIIKVIVKGINIDRGSNLFDYLSGLSENELQDAIKTIRNNKTVKNGANANVLKMLVGMFYLSVIGEGNMACLRGKLIEQISFLTGNGKNSLSPSVYGPVFDDYFIREFDSEFKCPEWNKVKANEESIITVCDAILDSLKEECKAWFSIKSWCNDGIRIAKDNLEKRKFEEQIPKSRISDIESLARHYQDVEEKFRKLVYENDGLKKQVDKLEKNISGLNAEKAELKKTIKDLHGDMDEKNKDLDKAEKEIGERKALNDAFDALKKNDEGALLRDIANDLKAEYRDFIDSENDTMDVQLGEIYREKIKNIFKILEKKGVKVEQ